MNQRNKIIAAIIAIFVVTATSCEKEDLNNPSDLVGTNWVYKFEEVTLHLLFVDKKECTIRSGRNDGTYSANLSTYIWRYKTEADSWAGDIVMFKKNSDGTEGERAYIGVFKGNNIHLSSAGTEIVDEMTFKRAK